MRAARRSNERSAVRYERPDGLAKARTDDVALPRRALWKGKNGHKFGKPFCCLKILRVRNEGDSSFASERQSRTGNAVLLSRGFCC